MVNKISGTIKRKEKFINKANLVHDGIYDYSSVIYKHSLEVVEIK